MKKILLSILTLGLVGSAVYGATSAYFSDTEASTANTFTAGTINIKVDKQDPWSETGHFTIADMKPSSVFTREVTLENDGVNPADVWKLITVRNYTGGEHPESELSEDPSDEKNNIGSVIRYDMTIDDTPVILESDGYVMDKSDYQLPGTRHINGRYIYLGRLEPQATMKVVQSYHMDGSTTNWAQGDTMTFDIEFYAQQTSGGASAPSPELDGHAKGELDYIDIGDMASPDMLVHDAKDWRDDPDTGSYGGRDGGSTIAMLWGEGGSCTATNNDASFVLNAGAKTANKLVVRHLTGSANDSFDVYVNGVLQGSVVVSPGTETWNETPISVNFSGPATIRLVATASAWGSCSTYGQVAFNWAKITE